MTATAIGFESNPALYASASSRATPVYERRVRHRNLSASSVSRSFLFFVLVCYFECLFHPARSVHHPQSTAFSSGSRALTGLSQPNPSINREQIAPVPSEQNKAQVEHAQEDPQQIERAGGRPDVELEETGRDDSVQGGVAEPGRVRLFERSVALDGERMTLMDFAQRYSPRQMIKTRTCSMRATRQQAMERWTAA
jgi:hypothetical protein